MPFDGSGNFNRVRNWVNDALAGIKIKSDLHDSEDNNFASGLSNTITKDGQSQPTADIPFNGHKLVNVAAPTNPTDAATKGYADAIRSFSTAISLTGAVPQATIGFTVADIGFGARVAGTPAGSLNRFVWNDKPDLSGADVATLDDTGQLSVKADFFIKAQPAGTLSRMAFQDAAGNNRMYVSNDQTPNSALIATLNAAGAVQQTLAINNTGMALAQGAAAGTVLTTGNSISVATTPADTVFPVGHRIMAWYGAQVARNSPFSATVDNGNFAQYTAGGAGAALAGGWRVHGGFLLNATPTYLFLVQRVS